MQCKEVVRSASEPYLAYGERAPQTTDAAMREDNEPLLPVRSGNINLSTSGMPNFGWRGFSWSTQVLADNVHAYRLYFNEDSVHPSNDSNLYDAYPLRCLAN